MDIRKLHDAKAVEDPRQTVQLDAFMLDAEHVRLCECSASNMRKAHCQ
jgi:hypothetical protein